MFCKKNKACFMIILGNNKIIHYWSKCFEHLIEMFVIVLKGFHLKVLKTKI